MMGRREGGQGQFFYAFDLDKVVPPDHLVRQIDAVLDLNWVHKELARYYSHTGRPSIDPVLMIRMLIVGYVFAIRSERRICAEVQVNLAYRWFCKLGIEDSIPDHSVFCRARHERFRESDALRRVFEVVVAKCIAAGLVAGEGFSIDASLIKADAAKKKRVPGDQPIAWPKAEEASRAVREYLAALDAARTDEESSGADDSGARGGSSRRSAPKEVSLTDPQAAWVARKGADPFFAYEPRDGKGCEKDAAGRATCNGWYDAAKGTPGHQLLEHAGSDDPVAVRDVDIRPYQPQLGRIVPPR
jgi:transposase